MSKHIHILLVACCLLVSCSRQPGFDTVEDYLTWMNNADNGLVKSKSVNGYNIRIKYLPPNYQAYQELSGSQSLTENTMDSLSKAYEKSLTFLMSIAPDEHNRKGDVMYQGIKNYKEYKERFYEMSFDMEKQVFIKIDDMTYRPVLTTLENIYGLQAGRNIVFVFVPADSSGNDNFYSSSKIDFVFEDNLFDTGINHFVFNRSDINNIPVLKIQSNT